VKFKHLTYSNLRCNYLLGRYNESRCSTQYFVFVCYVILVRKLKYSIGTNVREISREDVSGHGSCTSGIKIQGSV